MNTPRGQAGWTQDPDILSQEIDETRADVGETLEALQEKLSPSQLFDQSVNYLGQTGYDLACRLGESVRANPVPYAIAGAGLLWYLSRRGGEDTYGNEWLEDDGSVAYDTQAAYDTSPGTAGRLRAAAGAARQRASDAASTLAGRAARAQGAVRERAHRAGDGFSRLLHEQPLLVGAIGVAVGAAIAALLPLSQTEDRLLGSASERFVERAKQKTSEQVQKVRETAKRAADGARRAVHDSQPGNGGSSGSNASATSGGASSPGSSSAQPF